MVCSLESSPTAYDVNVGYALCMVKDTSGNKLGSHIITFSTALENRGEIVCNPMPSANAHRGNGDISLAADRWVALAVLVEGGVGHSLYLMASSDVQLEHCWSTVEPVMFRTECCMYFHSYIGTCPTGRHPCDGVLPVLSPASGYHTTAHTAPLVAILAMAQKKLVLLVAGPYRHAGPSRTLRHRSHQ
jgi:hypothetical protein